MKNGRKKRWKWISLLGAMIVGGIIFLGIISTNITSQETLSQLLSANEQIATQEPSIVPTVEPTVVPTPEPTLKPTPEPTPEPIYQATITAVGDNLIHSQIINSGKQTQDGVTYDHLFTHIKEDIEAADVAIINQETVLGGKSLGYSGYPRFNSPTEIGDAIVNAGFDVVLHATNHTMDKGEAGLQNTLDFWKQYPDIAILGVNETEEESHEITVVEVNGIKIAMLNYTYGLNGLPQPKERPYMVELLEEEKIRSDVEKAKEISDFIVVFPHWGNEYVYKPVESQRKWATLFLELEVDLVIGAHPHILETIEWMEHEEGHKMLVYYSLGNYMSSQSEVPRMLGGMANVTIEKVGDEKAQIVGSSITPLVTHREGSAFTVYKLEEYTEALAKKHKLSSKGLSVKKLKTLASDILGEWYIEQE